jgi:tetratricopeptide (TPR) repeat protein
MSAIKPPKKISKRQELRQDQVVTFYAKAWDFFDKNRKLVYSVLGAVAAVVVIAIGIMLYGSAQNRKAAELLGEIVRVYEQGDYRAALDGVDGRTGLIEIANKYGSTETGNMATYYAADALFRLGEYDQALTFFKRYDKDDNIIGASALAAEAAIYEQREEYERAGNLYRRAALIYKNELTSPQYLLDAGRAYEKAGEYDKARSVYQEIQKLFPESPTAGGIDFYLARVNAMERGSAN